jgi:hypothetical protein
VRFFVQGLLCLHRRGSRSALQKTGDARLRGHDKKNSRFAQLIDSKRLYRKKEAIDVILKRILVQDHGKPATSRSVLSPKVVSSGLNDSRPKGPAESMPLPQLPYWLFAANLLLRSPIFV